MANSGTSLPTWRKATLPTPPSLSAHTPTIPTSYALSSFSHPSFYLANTYHRLVTQTDPCGLQLFHLLSHTDGAGGQTLLVDGFYVASILKELHPSAYDILSRVAVPAHAAGEPGCLYTATSYPVLSHAGKNGELAQVRWNNDDRSTMSHLSANEVEEWCVCVLFDLMGGFGLTTGHLYSVG